MLFSWLSKSMHMQDFIYLESLSEQTHTHTHARTQKDTQSQLWWEMPPGIE